MAHIHSVFDSNEHFVIDPVTREITNSLAKKIVVMQFDHNSERFTFEIPKVDGHNMANCDRVEIHYINVDAVDKTLKSTGVYEVNDIQPSPDDNSVAVFSWLLSRNCTKYAGTLSFLIHFACTTDGVEDYAWNTAIFQSITIGNGMNNGAEVLEPFPDILAQWQAQLFSASETAVLNVTTAEANALAAIEAAGEAKKQAVLDSIPDEYEALSALADQNHRNKSGAIVLDAEGESIVVNDASEYPLQNLKVFGKSAQDETPTPDAPVDIVSTENPVLEVCGKNLAYSNVTRETNFSGVAILVTQNKSEVVLNGTSEKLHSYGILRSRVLPNGKYTVSVYGLNVTNSSTDRVYIMDNDTEKVLCNNIQDGKPKTFEITKPGIVRVDIVFGEGSTYDNRTVKVQIENGDVATEYESYKLVQTVETLHALPGIPVSSGGNYTDENGQSWICDEVDLARGVYVQRVESKEFDGVDGETITLYAERENVYGFALKIPDMDMLTISHAAMCTRLENIITGISSVDKECFLCGAGTKTIYVMVNKERISEYSVAAFKEWLSANPITILFQLATPIETPLSEAEISAFKALHSNRPNTVILNDAGAHMAVSYVADTKTYIDNKIAEMMKGVVE